MSAREKREDAVEVPHGRLASEVLRRLIEEFVTRDGTDYGDAEKDLEEKVADLARALERGEVVIVYEAESGTINVVPKRGPPRAPRSPTKGAPDG